MRTNNDKVAQICALYWMYIRNATIINQPGSIEISVSGKWENIPFNKASLKEEQTASGSLVTQEFNASISGLSQSAETTLHAMNGELGIIRIDYTNGDKKIVGTNDIPIILTLECNASTHKYSMSFKRNSPEFSKYLKSF